MKKFFISSLVFLAVVVAFARISNAQFTTTQSVVLSAAEIRGSNLYIKYSKNFATCVHLKNENNQIMHVINFFCTQGNNIEVTKPLSSFFYPQGTGTTTVKVGQKVNHDERTIVRSIPEDTLD